MDIKLQIDNYFTNLRTYPEYSGLILKINSMWHARFRKRYPLEYAKRFRKWSVIK